VTNIEHTMTGDGRPLLEFTLRVVNGSTAELGVDPEAQVNVLLTDHTEVTMSPEDSASAVGHPECYTNVFMGGTDSAYHLQPGESITLAKKLCYVLDPSKASPPAAVSFSDENGPAAEVVKIG